MSSNLNKLLTGAALLALVNAPAALAQADLSKVPAGKYAVDPTHAYIQFRYNHLGLSNPILSFDDFSVDLDLASDPTQSSVAVGIVTESVVTGSPVFHDHLTGGKWFDSAANPAIDFKSTGISGSGANYKLTGDLTIKGVTKPITLDVTINAAKDHPMKKKPVIGMSATGALKRSEWGLGANAPYISDDVQLQIEAELVKN